MKNTNPAAVQVQPRMMTSQSDHQERWVEGSKNVRILLITVCCIMSCQCGNYLECQWRGLVGLLFYEVVVYKSALDVCVARRDDKQPFFVKGRECHLYWGVAKHSLG